MNVISTVDMLVAASGLLALVFLFRSRLLRSDAARATVTPLASIIGSGFLILAPILVREFGGNAVIVMAGLCLTSYAMGWAIRSNIDIIGDGHTMPFRRFEWLTSRAASAVLTFAYVVSVCYYLNLLGSFFVSLTPFNTPTNAKIVTTAVLVLIATLGWVKGLRGLESAEQISVGVKLAIITSLLVGMSYHGAGLAYNGELVHHEPITSWYSVRVAFGLLIAVQGFETSRYLRSSYDTKTLISTMKYSQWISTAIYLAFIGLASVEFSASEVGAGETAVIGMMRQIAGILPYMLVVAALASQFSAAVADTNGCGGMAEEITKGKINARQAYAILVVIAITLTWTADIFQIISYASRVFAGYYALQCLLAMLLSHRSGKPVVKTIFFGVLAVFSFLIMILGIPAE